MDLEGIKDSVLWEDSCKQYENLSLSEKVDRLSKVIYPNRNGRLTLEDRLDIIMKHPEPIKLIGGYLNEREYTLLKLIDDGRTLSQASEEMGFQNRSSATQIMRSIRNKLEGLLEDELDLEEEIIRMTGGTL